MYDKKYKYLETEYRKYSSSPKTFKSFYEHLIYTVDDVSITNTIKTLMSFANKRINIFKLKEDVKKIRSNPNIILTTAHAFKGLEADMVYIEDDLNSSVNKTIQTEFKDPKDAKTIEELSQFCKYMCLGSSKKATVAAFKNDLHCYGEEQVKFICYAERD